MCPLHIVAEGEEGVAAQADAAQLGYPLLFLFAGERLGLPGEELLPCSFAQHVVGLVANVEVDGVVAVGAADALFEWQCHHLRALAQPPDVGLLSGQSGAVDAALLTGTDADGLSVFHVADGVRLRVFQCDKGDNEVATGLLGEGLVLGGNVFEQGGVVETDLVAALLEGDAEDLFALNGSGTVGRVDLDDVVGAFALVFQNLDGFGRIVGCNHTVAHLALEQGGGGRVAGVGESHEVAIRRHAVGSAGTGIGASQRREFHLHVVDEIDFLQRVAQRQTYSGSGGRHMLERCCSGQAGGLFQLADQLPRVERVEQVDVAGTAVDNFNGQLSLFHVYARGLLIGVASVL